MVVCFVEVYATTTKISMILLAANAVSLSVLGDVSW
jgi:hypothetical protein